MAPSRASGSSNLAASSPGYAGFGSSKARYSEHDGSPEATHRRKTVPAVTAFTDDSDSDSVYAAKRSHSMPAKKVRRGRTKRVDNEHDSDYDPLDKYYLSAEDEYVDHRSPTGVVPRHAPQQEPKRSKSSSGRQRHESHRQSSPHSSKTEKPRRSDHHRDHGSKTRHPSRHHTQHAREPSRERSRHHSRDHQLDDDRGRREESSRRSTRHHSSSRDHRSRGRRSPDRDSSRERPRRHSTHSPASRTNSRPQLKTRSSSYDGRKSKSNYPPSASRTGALHRESLHEHSTNTSKTMDFPWSQAAQCAMRAGAMAALKVGREPGPWIGIKGGKVASAALGAAVVDGFMAQRDTPGVRSGGMRHATMRHLTELAISNMVAKPAMKNISGHRRR